ncbi:PREDICTED: uncharacterized protein LOC107122758 [Gekko japonicus]|uniref:Uncharacterized protein LOC107122758 n=1 Tax=Gekko japonicus TaxID=146911 RepID=A0ABM1L5Z1_GEKJA|nr:PREDICTED: uncharacterized protein LOC107122758 [Gekko japonicus]
MSGLEEVTIVNLTVVTDEALGPSSPWGHRQSSLTLGSWKQTFVSWSFCLSLLLLLLLLFFFFFLLFLFSSFSLSLFSRWNLYSERPTRNALISREAAAPGFSCARGPPRRPKRSQSVRVGRLLQGCSGCLSLPRHCLPGFLVMGFYPHAQNHIARDFQRSVSRHVRMETYPPPFGRAPSAECAALLYQSWSENASGEGKAWRKRGGDGSEDSARPALAESETRHWNSSCEIPSDRIPRCPRDPAGVRKTFNRSGESLLSS